MTNNRNKYKPTSLSRNFVWKSLILMTFALSFAMPVRTVQAQDQNLDLTFTILTPELDFFTLSTFDFNNLSNAPTIFQATLINNSGIPRLLIVELIFTRQSTGSTLTISTNPFTIEIDETIMLTNRDLAIGADPRFEATGLPSEAEINQFLGLSDRTGFLPQDTYGVALDITDLTGGGAPAPSGSGNIVVTNPFRVDLVNPPDRSEVMTLNPNFQWISNTNSFTLTIVPEALANQDVLRTLPFGSRIFQITDLAMQSFTYPSSAEALENDKTYCWQVSAKVESSVGGESFLESEISCFTVRVGGAGTVDPLLARLKAKYPNRVPDAVIERLRGYSVPEAARARLSGILNNPNIDVIEVKVEQ